MPVRFVRDFSAVTGVAPEGSRVAVQATLAPSIRLALTTGNPVIPMPPGGPSPAEQLIPIAATNGPLEGNVNLPAGAQSMIQLGSSSMFVPGDYSGSLPSSTGGQGSAIIDLIGKGIGLAGSILARNNAQAPTMGQIQAANPSVADSMLQLGKLLKGQTGSQIPLEVQKGLIAGTLKPKRHRRINPLNPKALRRSMSRVQRFAKFAKKTISFTQRVRMKKHRRR